jgi:hypothetical protein
MLEEAVINLCRKPRQADVKTVKAASTMAKITLKPSKRKADEILDANLDEYADESSSSQASGSDPAADDGAGNLPTPPKRKKRKAPVLTKRKARKAPGKTRKKVSVEADDGSDSESSNDDTEAQNKSALFCYVDVLTSMNIYVIPSELILLVPCCTNDTDAIERVTLSHPCLYSTALTKIYEIIGCEAVTLKPDLSYRLSSSAVKSAPISLRKDEDWDGLLDDIRDLEMKKRVTISVKIVVPEHVSSYQVDIYALLTSCLAVPQVPSRI